VKRTIVVGDLHLSRGAPKKVGDAFAKLLGDHPGSRVVVCGDFFDFSADHPTSSVEDALGAHPLAKKSLAEHVERGGELWLAAGNHDSEVGSGDFASRLACALGLRSPQGRIRISPWFFRIGSVHIEHGHLFDPDNAPAHPLVQGEVSLGVHFVRELIAKTGAHAYLNRNDETPLKLFLSSFTLYGQRAPFVIYKYFETAFRALARSGPFFRSVDPDEACVATFARDAGISEAEARRLASIAPPPTLASMTRTFARLYLDRVAATLALASGAGLFAFGKRGAGASLAALGAIGLVVSWSISHDRYGGAVEERLRRGAADVRQVCAADLVIFGHTHREHESEGYANTGSFAFPRTDRGRPYLELHGSRAVRRYL
jgi:predicted phosphodiesterase